MSQQILAKVIAHQEVARYHYRLTLLAPEVAVTAQAGQYVHVLTRSTQNYDPLLRRAFSILNAENGAIEILYRVEGRGTALLAALTSGATVDIIGPLGLPFAPLTACSLLVGGGVGVPPLAMLAAQYHKVKPSSPASPISLTALIGARSQAEIICREDFERYGVPVEVATDDGREGHHGRVTDLLQKQLQQVTQDLADVTVFACGPLAMLRAVADLTARYGVRCQVSLEENMPCGLGVCNGCVVPVVDAGDDYGNYRRVCVDGPVMWANEVAWGHGAGAC